MTDSLTWTLDGLTFTATPPGGETGIEVKAKSTGKWTRADEIKHPRDSKGKWIETGAEVRILGVGLARVLGVGDKPGHTQVQMRDRSTREVPNGSITVTKRPDGSKPIGPKPGAPNAPQTPPEAKPGTPQAPRADRAQAPAAPARIDSPEAVRAHWASGAESNPDLTDQHREFLRAAGAKAADIQLSDGGNLVLLQAQKGGPWRITNHHGQNIGPEQPDVDTARAIANRLETELVDADGNPLDMNSPGFAERAQAFRSADGESLSQAAGRIFSSGGSAPDEGTGGRTGGGGGKPAPKPDGELVAQVAKLRELANGEPWKPLKNRAKLQDGRARIKETAAELADAIENNAHGHEVTAAFDRYAAAIFDATHNRRGGTLDRPGGDHVFGEELRKPGRAAYLQWRASQPNEGRPTGRRFSSVDQVREHLAGGGDSPMLLSTSRRDRDARDLSARIGDDSVLAGGGSFVAVRNDQGKWNLYQSANGQALVPRTDFDSRADAVEMADALKGIDTDHWDHPDNWLSDQYPIDQVQDVLAERAERLRRDQEAGGGTPEPTPDGGGTTPEPTPEPEGGGAPESGFGSVDDLRAYLRSAPEAAMQVNRMRSDSDADYQRELDERRAHLEALADNSTLELTPSGQLAIYKGEKRGSGWTVITPGAVLRVTAFTKVDTRKEALELARRFEEELVGSDGKRLNWASPTLADDLRNTRAADGDRLDGKIQDILGQYDVSKGRTDSIYAQHWARTQERRGGGGTAPGPEPTPEPTPGPDGGGTTGRFTSIDQVREHFRKLAEVPGTPEDQANYLRAMADDPEWSGKLFLSPGGTLVMRNFDARTVDFTHAASGLSLAATGGGKKIWSEWGGRKAHLELARRLETRMLDADGSQLDWSNPDLRQVFKTWRSEHGETGLEAAWRIKGEWDYENRKDTIAARDYRMQAELPDRPAAGERRAYGDEVKPGDILNVSRVDKRVTAVDSAGWGRYRVTFEDDTSGIVSRNETLLRGVGERYVTNGQGEVIGENVPAGVLKPGDQIRLTVSGATSFNVRDQQTLRQNRIDGYRNVTVEGTLIEDPDPGSGRGGVVLTGVTVRQGDKTVRLGDLQRDNLGNTTRYRLPDTVTRLGETSASDADREAARARRLAEIEQNRLDQADAEIRQRLNRVYGLDVPSAARLDDAELARRRAELAEADRPAVDAAAARLHVALANRPQHDPKRDAELAAYATALGERMNTLGYLNQPSRYRDGWATAEGLQGRRPSAWQRILSGEQVDDEVLRGVADMAAALGKPQLVAAVQDERDRRIRQPDPRHANPDDLVSALTEVNAGVGQTARDLLAVLHRDTPRERVDPAWARFDDTITAAIDSPDVDPATSRWLQNVSDDMADRMRQAGHRPTMPENRERLAHYATWDNDRLRAELSRASVTDDHYDDLVEELERRGFNEEGHHFYGSSSDLADPRQPSKDLIGQRVAAHDGRGGWVQGYLHQRGKDWVVSQSPDDPGDSPTRLRERSNRQAPFVEPVHPGHPALADLDKAKYSTEELDGELNRLAPQIQELWAADRRRGDPEFDRLFARYNELVRERQDRPDPEPEPPRQDEVLFDETGSIAGDALPPVSRGQAVKASTLAVGDRIEGGQVEQVTRIRDMVFATIRDGDDRRTVRGFAPDADVRRIAASGEAAPEPVTVADAPSADLGDGDRVLIARHDGATLPATVTGITDEGDTRRLDVRYDDGSTHAVYVDRGEVVPRLGGPEAGQVTPDPTDGDVADEPAAEAVPMAAGKLKAGDRFQFNAQADVYEVVSIDTSGATAVIRARRERDGAEFSLGLGKTQPLFKLPPPAGQGGGKRAERRQPQVKPLPKGTTSARPVLYTYQRRNLNWMGLTGHKDATVQQAALRVRERLPLSADQAAALAQAVRAQAAGEKPGRQRSMERLAYTLDAAAAEARGLPRPRKPEGRGTPFKARATNLVEGDTVALPGARGRARVGKVVGKRTLMGGRLVELDIEYPDGSTERRLLNRDTDSYVLPDLPDDVPLPPKDATPQLVQVDIALFDLDERLADHAGELAQAVSIAVGERLAGQSFPNRDAAVAAAMDAYDGMLAATVNSNGIDRLRRPRGWRGRSLSRDDAQRLLAAARRAHEREMRDQLPPSGPVDHERLLEAASSYPDRRALEAEARSILKGHDPGVSEHITAGDLQPGDVVIVRGGEYEVSAITDRRAGATTADLLPTGLDPRAPRATFSHRFEVPLDEGPSIVRVARGESSASQPWDGIIRDDPPETRVEPGDVAVGDRLMMEDFGPLVTVGRVYEIGRITEGGGTLVRLRAEDGTEKSYTFMPGQPSVNFVRLQKGSADVADQLARQRAEREQRQTVNRITSELGHVAFQIFRYHASVLTPKVLQGGKAAVVRRMWEGPSIADMFDWDETAERVVHALGVTEPGIRAQLVRQVKGPLLSIASRAHDQFSQSLHAAQPLPGESEDDAVRRVVAQFRDSPPDLSGQYAQAAQALAALRPALTNVGPGGGRAPDVPQPTGAALVERVNAYRAALGAPAQFGKVQVRRATVRDMRLEDLEAGKTPEIDFRDMAVDENAADGGPGVMAMRHLDIVKAAGRDLDADLARRMNEAGVGRLQAELDAAQAKAKSREFETRSIRDRLAAEAGFPDFEALEQMRRTRTAGVDEAARLGALYRDIWERARDERLELLTTVDNLTRRVNDERRRAALALLAEIRPDGLGGTQIDWHDKSAKSGNKKLTERSELVKAMRFAERSYPTRWLELFRDHAEKAGQKWKIGKIKRGHYQDFYKLINLSDGRTQTTEGGKLGDVAVHEMGHGMERAVPGLMAAERAFLWARTSTGEIGQRTREKKTMIYAGEYGYRDQFPEHYSGKDYVRGGREDAFELFTTGMESLVAGSPYLDDDFRQWLLGVLALLGTPEEKS